VSLDLASIQHHVSDSSAVMTTTTTTGTTSKNKSLYNSIILENHGQDWRELVVHLFEQQHEQNHGTNNSTGTRSAVVYRVAESGSPDAAMVEPKQSLEVQRCSCGRRRHHHCPNEPSSSFSFLNDPPASNQEEEKFVEPAVMATLHMMQAWTDLFHQVACTVRQVLNFPKNVLLQEEPCRGYSFSNPTNAVVLDNDDVDRKANYLPCSVDLLRAFYYETAAAATSTNVTATGSLSPSCSSSSSNNSRRNVSLGSNEHTDWGSFTIVWQDDVEGCLQTYCHACDSWNNVQVAQSLRKKLQHVTKSNVNSDDNDDEGMVKNNSNNMLYLVVHVGDVTSLAIGQQGQQHHQQQPTEIASTNNTDTFDEKIALSNAGLAQRQENHGFVRCSNNTIINSNNNEAYDDYKAVHDTRTTTTKTVIWPSPRHRVCLPTEKQQRRASLVYFAYPPPDLSIETISQRLCEWYQHNNTTTTMTCSRGHGGDAPCEQTAVPLTTWPQTASSSAVAAQHGVPYQDYYLLRNQAASSAETDNKSNNKTSSISMNASSQRQFERIASIPLRTVLTEKWNQVQRGAS
jgi:hypothetical protein